MRKLLFTIISFLMPMLAMGQILYENDFTGITEFYGWTQFDDSQTDGKVEVDPDGVAITVGIQTGQLWQPQTMVVPDGSFDLVVGGKYKVVITAKFPSNGTLQIRLGNWVNFNDAQLSITATGDYQEIVFNFDNYSVDAESAHLLFQCGDFKGTTIIKKVVVYGIGPDLCYNYINKGKVAEVIQNPKGKYTGAVEIPATVIHEGLEYTVKKISDDAFFGCSGLTSITIPNTVTHIGNDAFAMCPNLNSVYIKDLEAWCKITFNDTPLSYAHHLFLNGEEIKDLVIPNSITSIGDKVFECLSSLTSVTMHNNVTSIGISAFSGCSALTSIPIPNSVTSIGNYAFSNCIGLTSVTIPNSVASIDCFSGCIGLTSVTIPNGITRIGGFSGCTALTSVTIPNSVISIEKAAFGGCSGLISVTIGNGVLYISESAFANCENLNDVYCLAENVPDTDFNAFENSYIEYATLHVPAASLNNYETAYIWKDFQNKVALSGGDIPVIPKCATPTITFENGEIIFSCETEGVEYVSSSL